LAGFFTRLTSPKTSKKIFEKNSTTEKKEKVILAIARMENFHPYFGFLRFSNELRGEKNSLQKFNHREKGEGDIGNCAVWRTSILYFGFFRF